MIKISTINKNSFKKNDAFSYVFNQDNYNVFFFADQFNIIKPESVEKELGFFKRLINRIKSNILSTKLSNETNYVEPKNLNILFKNSNKEPICYLETADDSTLIYYNIYNGINLKCTIENEDIICTFILSSDCNPKDIHISFNQNTSLILDEKSNLLVTLNNSHITFKKSIYKDTEIDYILDKSNTDETNNTKNIKYILDVNEDILKSIDNTNQIDISTQHQNDITQTNNEVSIFTQENPYNPNNYPTQQYNLGTRKLIIPVSKLKYRYPHDFTTTLIATFNTPIINKLLVEKRNDTITTSIPICDSGMPPTNVSATITSDEITPTISFSVILNKASYPINFGDIFGYEEDYFMGDCFCLSNPPENKIYYPVDYTFIPIEPQTVDYVKENDEYYFYEVDIKDITIYPTPALVVPPDIQYEINNILGNSPDNPITPGELSEIITISFKDKPSINGCPEIFKYMPNLLSLNLSNCGIDSIFLQNLKTLPNLESLDISGNPSIVNIDLLPESLFKTLKCLDASFNPSTLPPCTAYTTFIANTSGKITDVSHLAKATELISLKLSNQSISDLTPLSSLLELGKLEILLVDNQELNIGNIYPSESMCSANCDFSMETNFLKNIEGYTPLILCISNYGFCWSYEQGPCIPCDSCDLFVNCGDSTDICQCDSIVWEGIMSNTEVYFTFKDDIILGYPKVNYIFSGTTFAKLVIND